MLPHSIGLATKSRPEPTVVTVTWSRTLLQKSRDKDQRSGFGMQQGGRVRPVEPDNIADILHFPLLCNISARLYLASPPNISNCPLVTAVPGGVERGLGDKQKDCEKFNRPDRGLRSRKDDTFDTTSPLPATLPA